MTKLSKLFTALLIAIFLLGIICTAFIRNSFAQTQLETYALSNPGITKVTVAWPRLISEPNDLAKFQNELADWNIDSSFLMFREMSDKRGNSFYLVGAESIQDFFATETIKSPVNCNSMNCEVIAAYPQGAQIPDVAGMGLVIVDSKSLAKKVPIPKDFGIDPGIPILITSQVSELSNWEPGRYLPATYGWQISPKTKDGLRTQSYKESLVDLESELTSNFANVAVNYPLNKLENLIENQEHFSALAKQSLNILFLIFLLILILFFAPKLARRKESLLILLVLLLLIQQLWDFATLLQIIFFLLLAISLTYLLIRVLDSKLLKKDFEALVLLRSSSRSIISISLLLILLTATFLSSYQYLARNQEFRKQVLDTKVPFDFALKISSSLDRPLDLGTLSEIEALSSNARALPVIRSTATHVDKLGNEREINLLAIGADKTWNEPRIKLPVGRNLTINTSGIANEIDLIIWLRTESGAHFSVTAVGSRSRTVKLPDSGFASFSIVAFELQENPINAARREHALGESTGRAFDILNGSGQISSISVDGTNVEIGKEWPISDFSYALIDGPLTLRPETEQKLSAITFSKGLAKAADEIQLNNQISIPIDKATEGKFAGAEQPFVIMDLADYQAIVSRTEPGSVDPLEIWVKTENPTTFVNRYSISKFQTLKLISRSELESSQRNSPYWKHWQKLYLSTFVFVTIFILLALLYFIRLLRNDLRQKQFELIKYFASRAPSLKSLYIFFAISLLSGVPILLISRFLSGLLS